MKKLGSRPRILVVEDEAIVAADIQDRLRSFGYDVAGWVNSAEEAIQTAAVVRPDLVLMDIMLKTDVPGTDAAHHIRTKLHLPVIYLSAGSSMRMFELASDTDPFGYIIKPFEEAMLRANIEIALYKHRMEREREELCGKLRLALVEVKTLSDLIPICAWCKNVRSDQDYWQSVEHYVRSRSSANFKHCICPSCEAKFRQDLRRARENPDISLPPAELG
jgi:two-component system, response regulator PdtaR